MERSVVLLWKNAACSNWRSRNDLTSLHRTLCSDQGILLSRSLILIGTNSTLGYSRAQYAGIQSWILQTGSGGKLKAPTALRDQVLGYLGKHEVGFNKQLWLIWQFTATEGWGFPSSLLPCFPTSLTFPIPSSHWLWHSLAFQLTNLTEKDLLRCCCCCCIGFSARLVSPSSSR